MSEAGSIAMAPTGARDSFIEIERPPIDTDLAGFFIFIDFHYFEFWPDHWDDARLRQWIEWTRLNWMLLANYGVGSVSFHRRSKTIISSWSSTARGWSLIRSLSCIVHCFHRK
jgi:hypothetical protein